MAEAEKNHPVSSFDLFTKSKKLVLANPKTYGLVFLLPFVFELLSNLRDSGDKTNVKVMNFSSAGLSAGFGLLLLVFIVLVVLAGIMAYILNYQSSKGVKPSLKELWPVMQKYGARLFGLILVTGLIIAGGLILFIVPGLIFLRRYFLAPYVMIDKDASISEALKESARLSKPHSGSVWGVIGVTVLLSIFSLIPVVGWLISFALTTLYAVAPALRYQELKKLS